MYPTDAETDAAIAAGKIKSALLVDLYVAPTVLRCWTWPGPALYPGTADLDGSTSDQAYESMFGRIVVPMAIRQAASLASEPIEIQIDGSRSGDDEDFVGRFVDSDWHQARVRVRQVLLNWETETLASLPMREWRGRLDHRELVQPALPDDGAPPPLVWNVTCQGGLFRIRGRRLKTRSHADQQLRSAGDMFYAQTAIQVGLTFNWSKAPGAKPGTVAGGGATGGSSGGSGGGSSGGGGKFDRSYDVLT